MFFNVDFTLISLVLLNLLLKTKGNYNDSSCFGIALLQL